MKQRVFVIAIVLVAFLAACVPALAGPHLFVGKRKKINCGVVGVNGVRDATTGVIAFQNDGLLGPGTGGGVGDIFYMMDSRTDLKPAGWVFENPYAPGSPSTGLGKNDPAYWIVDLSAIHDLNRMNVLYMPATGKVLLSEQDREKLRRFVDGGGVLWVDNAGTTTADCLNFYDTQKKQDTFFIQKFSFEKTGSPAMEVPASRHHPLIALPYWLTESEIGTLGYNWGKAYCNPGYDAGGFGPGTPTAFDVLLPVVLTSEMMGGPSSLYPSVAANAYGSGRIVATASYVGRGCFTPPFDVGNLKFAYNTIAWSSSWTHLRKDPRHSGSSIDTLGGTKLLKVWSLLERPTADVESAPVIYKNMVFYTSGSTVYALDMMPQEDLDQDGNLDDGYQGLPSGMSDHGQDLVWMWSPGAGAGALVLSSPTVVTAQNPGNPSATMDAVLVTCADGIVYMIDAFPMDKFGHLTPGPPSLVVPPCDLEAPNTKPSPPLYVGGWIYVVDGPHGHVHAFNPSIAGMNPPAPAPAAFRWESPAYIGSGTKIAEVKSGLTYGLMRNENNNAIVGMLYWYTKPWGPITSGEPNDFLHGIPVFVANDRLRPEQTNPDRTRVQVRITYGSAMISSLPAPIVWVAQPTTVDVLPDKTVLNKDLGGNVSPGSMVIETTGPLPADAIVYGTFALDYMMTMPGTGPDPTVNTPLQPTVGAIGSTTGLPVTQNVCTPAMGTDSMIYTSGKREASGGDGGGSVYGLKDNSFNTVTKWNYYIHGGADVPATSGPEVKTIPAVVTGKLGNTPFPVTNCNPTSAPLVAGDKVFVAVKGQSTYGSVAALLCLKANPDFIIRITQNGGVATGGSPVRTPKKLINAITKRQSSVKIWQPNLLVSSTIGPQPLMEAVPVPMDMIDHDRGTITFKEFDRMKLRSTAGGMGMMQTNTFSPSLPVWVFVDNVEIPIDYSTWGPSVALGPVQRVEGDSVDLSQWNSLLWYYVIPETGGVPCTGISSTPVVIGNKVYFVTNEGVLFALSAETGETQGGMSTQKPEWQDSVLDATSSATTFGPDTHTSVAASNGVLLVPGPDGLHAYSNMTTLVGDSNRAVEVDGAGEIGWSLDSISWPIAPPPTNGGGTWTDVAPRRTGPISKPSRVRYITSGNILLTNTGANQVCKIDKGGIVGADIVGGRFIRWMYDKFADPKQLLRSGDSTHLSSPSDALLWQEIEPDGSNRVITTHCLIADSGNHRIIDLVYRIDPKAGVPLLNSVVDPDSGYYLPELNWVTKTDSTNERFVYSSIQLVRNPVAANGHDIWAAVSNYGTGTGAPPVSGQGLGGAIVGIKYRVPAGTDGWDYNAPDSGKIVAACDRVSWGGIVRPLASPRYFEVIAEPSALPPGGPTLHLLVCDNNGVFKAGPLGGATPPLVEKALVDKKADPFVPAVRDYRTIERKVTNQTTGYIASTDDVRPGDVPGLGVPLVATSAQELPNGNWLIANGFSGTSVSGTNTFSGEVFEVAFDSAKLPSSIVWSAPGLMFRKPQDEEGIPGAWMEWWQAAERGAALQQPKSAFRQL